MKDKIIRYLERLTGGPCSLRSLSPSLPLYLKRYRFYRTRIFGVTLVLAVVYADAQTPLEYKSAGVKLESSLGAPVIFVFEFLSTNKRNALLRHRVSFVIPGRQCFFPPLFELREHEPQPVVVGERLHFPAQAIVLRELLKGDVSSLSLKALGDQLGFSAMSMTTAAKELKATGFAEIRDGSPCRIVFAEKGRTLWETTRSRLASPVKKRVYLSADMPGLPLAGVSALSERTMINPDRQVVRAVSEGAYRAMKDLRVVENLDESMTVLEVWGYDPLKIGGVAVDDLSLWLSLQREAHVDPRVEGELESLLESHKWL